MGARMCGCAVVATLLLGACSPDGRPDNAAPAETAPPAPSFSPPAPSFSPEGPPRVPSGFREVVVGGVGISAPRTWAPCALETDGPWAFDGPSAGFAVPEWPGRTLTPLIVQVEPLPGGKLFDARSVDSRVIDVAIPDNESRIGEVDVPNAVQTSALEFFGRIEGIRVTMYAAWVMGADGTRVRLTWLSERTLWAEMEKSYRDVAASLDFESDKAATDMPPCADL